MTGRKRFVLVLVALLFCVTGFAVDLLQSGKTNWTVLVVGAALLPLAALHYHRMRAERLLASIRPTKQD